MDDLSGSHIAGFKGTKHSTTALDLNVYSRLDVYFFKKIAVVMIEGVTLDHEGGVNISIPTIQEFVLRTNFILYIYNKITWKNYRSWRVVLRLRRSRLC